MDQIFSTVYQKWIDKQEEAFQLRLLLVEIKTDLNLAKLGYRNLDGIIEKIDKELNK